jgi:DNA ligase (NAD+)
MNYDDPFMGKSIAVTDKLNNYTRDGIKARLLELGANPVSKVSRRTDYLILGERPGSKLVKARTLGIVILSEQEFEDMIR